MIPHWKIKLFDCVFFSYSSFKVEEDFQTQLNLTIISNRLLCGHSSFALQKFLFYQILSDHTPKRSVRTHVNTKALKAFEINPSKNSGSRTNGLYILKSKRPLYAISADLSSVLNLKNYCLDFFTFIMHHLEVVTLDVLYFSRFLNLSFAINI